LLNLEETIRATKGATHVYLSVGITYNAKIWAEQWPIIMSNVIKACEDANAVLIFLDNVYMYGQAPLKVPFDENHPQNPSSKKGAIRKQIADFLMDAHKSGRIKTVIGRSADFFGPSAVNSTLYISFLERMLVGKAPQILGKIDVKHTFAYTADIGRALVALATDETTYGQAWHLPVYEPLTMIEITEKFNKSLGTNLKATMMPRPMLGLLALFIPIVKEVKEMLYQFDNPYVMDFEKFKKHFPDFVMTPMDEGIKGMIDSFASKK